MAKALKEMPKSKRLGRTAKHPYEEWFTKAQESPIELIRGKDFDSKPRTMRHNLYRFAKANDYKVQTVTLEREDGTESLAIKVTANSKKK